MANQSTNITLAFNLNMPRYLEVLSDIRDSVQVTIACLIIPLNVLTIAAVVMNHNLHTTSNYFLAHLAASDLLIGMYEIISNIAMKSINMCDQLHINSITYFMFLMYQGSFGAIFLVGLDRYWAIQDPLRYVTRMTSSKVLLYASISWLVAILGSTVVFTRSVNQPRFSCQFPNEAASILPSFMLLCAVYYFIGVSMGVMYMRMWLTARGQQRKVTSMQAESTNAASRTTTRCSEKEPEVHATLSRTSGMSKASRLVLCVLITYFLAWSPLTIFTTAFYISDLHNTTPLMESAIQFQYLLLFGAASSCLNTFIYACNNRDFRTTYRALLTCKWKM